MNNNYSHTYTLFLILFVFIFFETVFFLSNKHDVESQNTQKYLLVLFCVQVIISYDYVSLFDLSAIK
jgi:hypothetical protein